MYHLIFLSLLSFLLCWNGGHSTTASLTLPSPKRIPPPVLEKRKEGVAKYKKIKAKEEERQTLERKKSRYATAEQFSGALHWAHKRRKITGKKLSAIILEAKSPSKNLIELLKEKLILLNTLEIVPESDFICT